MSFPVIWQVHRLEIQSISHYGHHMHTLTMTFYEPAQGEQSEMICENFGACIARSLASINSDSQWASYNSLAIIWPFRCGVQYLQ